MPNLPEISITADQASRILATFRNEQSPDGVVLSPAAAYQQWVKRGLRQRVIDFESQELDKELSSIKQTRLANLPNGLDI